MIRPVSPLGMFMLTGGGLGLLRPFPGTWGSLPPAVIAGGLLAAGVGPGSGLGAVYAGVMLVLIVIGCVACLAYGDQAEVALGQKDPSPVVADEIAGMGVTLLGVPALSWGEGARLQGLAVAALAFLLFRVLDVVKPWPCRQLQRLQGGQGILVDDLLAGAMGLVVLQVGGWILG